MSDRWQRLLADFEAAAALHGAERERFLVERRSEDSEAAAELERLLRADSDTGPLDEDPQRLLAGLGVAGHEAEAKPSPEEITLDLHGVVPAVSGIPPVIGRYQVAERIGRGGFGDVYRGFDPALKRAVAIKTCLLADPVVRQRFVREAELAARLVHPNIVTIHDFGTDGEVPYLVQELLPGEDLAERLARGGELTLSDKLRLLLHVAAGLAHAHAAGIVHRDVKPGNLRLLPDGRVKILDFGIARELGAAAVLTGDDRAVGTIAYMAPEQARGELADARADVHGWGAVAYELLSGRRAVPGDSPAALLFKLLDSAPTPLRTVAPDCPAELAALVDRCLERDPAKRCRDGGELLALLEPMARRLVPSTELVAPVAPWTSRPASGWRWRAVGWAAGVAAAVTLVVAGRLALQVPGESVSASVSSNREVGARQRPTRLAAGAPAQPEPSVPPSSGAGPPSAAVASPQLPSSAPLPTPSSTNKEATAEVAPAAVPASTGVLQVDARPWGELVRLVAADGSEVPLPEDAVTPLVITLPEGSYTAWLRHPQAGAARSCEAHVEAGGRTLCRVELRALRASDLLGGPAS